ncbi:hypothetical protein HMPREF0322_00380 [Desulfitobacterium hafniense DP7]|uniref:Uncharacterized protein n=1 Tax=Desulfitobacterium hafniense DP7 TaxID=537010 RepID=G9XHF5_DESHA|nr:hypothetical protein HMPREF0322_00380 [Desulfitobacterium hafniense DP7]
MYKINGVYGAVKVVIRVDVGLSVSQGCPVLSAFAWFLYAYFDGVAVVQLQKIF